MMILRLVFPDLYLYLPFFCINNIWISWRMCMVSAISIRTTTVGLGGKDTFLPSRAEDRITTMLMMEMNRVSEGLCPTNPSPSKTSDWQTNTKCSSYQEVQQWKIQGMKTIGICWCTPCVPTFRSSPLLSWSSLSISLCSSLRWPKVWRRVQKICFKSAL